jgi:electron transport complex protein RnfD
MNNQSAFQPNSPHQHRSARTDQVMLRVMLGTIPATATLFYFFGWGVIFNLLLCCSTAVATEAVILRLRQRAVVTTIKDNSALVTGLLLALALPPLAPWWIAVIGTAFSMVFAKHLFGGLGFNPFNPAMVGYVLLLISFPVSMTSWLPPQEIAANVPNFFDSLSLILFEVDNQQNDLRHYLLGVDGFTMATPLDQIKTSTAMGLMIDEVIDKPIFDA